MSASREGLRTYARGRAYDPDRYPITPYHDPNGPSKSVEAEEEDPRKLTEEEKKILAESNPELAAQAAAAEKAAKAEKTADVPDASEPSEDGDYEEAYSDDGEDQ